MRMIAGVTPEWAEIDVYLNDVKQELVFEADDVEGKIWVEAKNYQGYEVLKGKVEFRKKAPQITQQSQVRGDMSNPYASVKYSGILYDLKTITCNDPLCEVCHPRDVEGFRNNIIWKR